MILRRWALALIGVTCPSALVGQLKPQVFGALSVVAVRASRDVLAQPGRLTGAAIGVETRLRLSKFLLDIRYEEGGLTRGGLEASDVVEAEFLAGAEPVPGLEIKTGPHLRSFIITSGAERLFFWEIRVRGQVSILEAWVRSYVEGWAALVGSVNFDAEYNSARGGEAGLIVAPPALPIWGRIGYRVDRGGFDDGGRIESIEKLMIVLGMRTR